MPALGFDAGIFYATNLYAFFMASLCAPYHLCDKLNKSDTCSMGVFVFKLWLEIRD